jgi:Ca2+-binding EF-hand superfamily protein
MNRLALTVLSFLLLLGASVAAADGAPPDETLEEIFAQTDSNGDGFVDRREYYIRVVDVYYLADVDRNGTLDAKEFEWTLMGEFEDADANGDAKVTLPELMNQGADLLEVADTDGDGQLSWKETTDAFEPD